MLQGLRRCRRWGFAALLFVATPALCAPLHGVALVIGEGRYDELPVLANPVKDARDIDRLLGDLGFDVDRVLNADGDELRAAIARFEDEAKDADVALVYYSGHGIEAKGQNFIAPVDTDLSSPETAGRSMIAVQPILDELTRLAPVSIILLDACRSDPFPPGQMIVLPGDTAPTPVARQGLAAVRGPVPAAAATGADPDSLGAVIGFSASPGEPALDGPQGENSPYAAALLKHFAAGGYSFGDVMTMVSEEVYLETRAKQLPWTNSSLRRVLTFAAPVQPQDQDQSAIRSERRKLLLSIAGTPTETQRYVESLAREQQVPLDALYGMLDVLGIKAQSAGGDLEQQLKQGAEKLKELMAERVGVDVRSDPELTRLGRLAAEAESEGALRLALSYRQQASARADTLLGERQSEVHRLRQDMTDIAATYAANAATAYLNFDYVQAAAFYGKAFDTIVDWDRDAATVFKREQGEALRLHGYYSGDNRALAEALAAYDQAQKLAPRDSNPKSWAQTEDRIGQAQQTLGERLTDDAMLNASIASYDAALAIRTRADAPEEWAATQNNLADALYTMGHRKRDIPTLHKALDAFDAALQVLTVEADPVSWTTIVTNKAVTLLDLAEFTYATTDAAEMDAYAAGVADPANIPEVVKAKGAANAYLDTAVRTVEDALAGRGGTLDPLDWAWLEHTLGTAYAQRGDMNKSVPDLTRAIAADRAALGIRTRDRAPALWTQTANNLAVALHALSEQTKDPAPVREAVSIYREALAITSRADNPIDWAERQRNLAQTLVALADYEDTLPNLEAAEAAWRAAAEVTTLDLGAHAWEQVQTGLSTTLFLEGLKGRNRAKALEAQAVAIATRDKLREIGQPEESFFDTYLPMIDQVLSMIAQ